MGGERRRRRLRRARHWPGDAHAGEPGSAQVDTESAGPAPDQRGAESVDVPPDQRGAESVDVPPAQRGAESVDAPPDQRGAESVDVPPAEPAAGPAADAAPTPATVHREPRPPAEPDGDQRPSRRRSRGPSGPRPGAQHRPSPADLAELAGSFALTAGVHDPEPTADPHGQQHGDDPSTERGLRGLVGGGSSQVNVAAAMRARDASRPGDEHLAAAEADLPIVRRGWVPRDELPRPGAGH